MRYGSNVGRNSFPLQQTVRVISRATYDNFPRGNGLTTWGSTPHSPEHCAFAMQHLFSGHSELKTHPATARSTTIRKYMQRRKMYRGEYDARLRYKSYQRHFDETKKKKPLFAIRRSGPDRWVTAISKTAAVADIHIRGRA